LPSIGDRYDKGKMFPFRQMARGGELERTSFLTYAIDYCTFARQERLGAERDILRGSVDFDEASADGVHHQAGVKIRAAYNLYFPNAG